MKTYKTKPDICPSCGNIQDAMTSKQSKRKPNPGDFSICYNCGAINQLDESLIMVKAETSILLDFASKQPDLFLDMQAYSHRIVMRGKIR